MLGRPPSVDPARLAWRGSARVGRAGYCFHQNGALETVLRRARLRASSRRHGHVWTAEDDRRDRRAQPPGARGRHGLPTDDNPGGRVVARRRARRRVPRPAAAGRGRLRAGRLPLRDHRGPRRRLVVPRTTGRDPSPVSRSRPGRPTAADGRRGARRGSRRRPTGGSRKVLVVQRRMRRARRRRARLPVPPRRRPTGRAETELTSYDDVARRDRRRLRALARPTSTTTSCARCSTGSWRWLHRDRSWRPSRARPMSDDLLDIADELYGLPLADFTPARDAKAKELKGTDLATRTGQGAQEADAWPPGSSTCWCDTRPSRSTRCSRSAPRCATRAESMSTARSCAS